MTTTPVEATVGLRALAAALVLRLSPLGSPAVTSTGVKNLDKVRLNDQAAPRKETTMSLLTDTEKTMLSESTPAIVKGLDQSGYEINKTVAAVIILHERALFVNLVYQGEAFEDTLFSRLLEELSPGDGLYQKKLDEIFSRPANGMLRTIIATPRGVTLGQIRLGKDLPS